jgi:hypothetical protein
MAWRTNSDLVPRGVAVWPTRRSNSRDAGVSQLEGRPVAADLGFVAIPQPGVAEDDGANAAGIDLNPFNAVRGDGAFDEGTFPQDLELLR